MGARTVLDHPPFATDPFVGSMDNGRQVEGVLAILILVLLLVVWVVVLAPGMWRRRVEQRAADSVQIFHRQLGVLQRAGRSLVPPAQRLRGADPSVAVRQPAGTGSAGYRRPTLLLVQADGTGKGSRRGHLADHPTSHRTSGIGQPSTGRPASGGRYFHPSACKRRRDVLIGLVASACGMAILGAVPPLHPLLGVAVVAAMLLAGYLVLLVRLRTVAVQRTASLRLLSDRQQQHWLADEQQAMDEYEADEPTAQVAIR